MEWKHKYSEMDLGRPSLSEVERRRSGTEHRFGDLKFYEFNERRSDGLFTKYVFIFNEKGENVTSFIRLYLDILKYSKRQRYTGALISGGHGFSYSSYLVGYLQNAGYKNFDQALYDLMLDKKIWFEI